MKSAPQLKPNYYETNGTNYDTNGAPTTTPTTTPTQHQRRRRQQLRNSTIKKK